MSKKDTFRVVTRGSDGSLLIRDYPTCDPLIKMHLQIGTDDCSTDLAIRGMPVFRGLIGPMPEGRNIVRYESPEVFETLTKEWGAPKPKGKRIRRKPMAPVNPGAPANSDTTVNSGAPINQGASVQGVPVQGAPINADAQVDSSIPSMPDAAAT